MVRFLICINSGLAFSYVIMWFIMIAEGRYLNADFVNLYTGAMLIHDGLGSSLFDFDLQAAVQQDILDGRSFRDGLLPFVSPPHTAIVLVPLAWLPLEYAYYVFSFLQLGALITTVCITLKLLNDYTLSTQILSILLLISLFPTYLTFILGNTSLFILLSITGCYYSMKKGGDFSAGVWLALGTIKPQLILMPFLMLIAAKNWRALAGFGLTMLPFMALTLYLQGWKIWLDYLSTLQEINQYVNFMGFYPAAMYNLKSAIYSSIAGVQYFGVAVGLSWAGLLAAVTATVLLCYKKSDVHTAAFELRFALIILMGLFFSPHLYGHDLILLYAPMLFMIVYAGNAGSFLLVKLFSLLPILFFVTEIVFRIRFGIKIPIIFNVVMMLVIGIKIFKTHRLESALHR